MKQQQKMDNLKNTPGDGKKGTVHTEESNKEINISKSKRKLRNEKDTVDDIEQKADGSNSKSEESGSPVAKRVRQDVIKELQESEICKSAKEDTEPPRKDSAEENTPTVVGSKSNKERQEDVGLNDDVAVDDCTCPTCHFVAKNPVALKVHVKRKHYRKISSLSKATDANRDNTTNKKPDSVKNIQDNGSEEVKTPEVCNENSCPHCSFKAESVVLLDEHIKEKHEENETLACKLCGFHCKDSATFQAHYLEKNHLQKQSTAAVEEVENLSANKPHTPECTKPEIKDTRNTRAEITGQSKTSEGLTLYVENIDSNMEMIQQSRTSENEAAECMKSKVPLEGKPEDGQQKTDLTEEPRDEAQKSSLRTKGKGSIQNIEQSYAENESPTQILLNMVEATSVTLPDEIESEIDNKNTQENENNTETEQSVASPYKSLINEEALSNIVDNNENNIERNFDFLRLNTAHSSSNNVEMEPKVDEISEKQESCVGQGALGPKTNKGGSKPKSDTKTRHTCSYCGHVFRDRLSLEIHVKRRHTKEMSFFCEPCGYACVAKADYDKHCQSNKHKTKASQTRSHPGAPSQVPSLNKADQQKSKDAFEIEVQIPRDNTKPTATRMAAAHLLKRSANTKAQLQCKSCSYKTSSSTVLLRHVRLKHSKEYHFHCKVCNYYTMTLEGMEKHITRKKHLQLAKKENLGISFEETVEKVCMSSSEMQKNSVQEALLSETQTGNNTVDLGQLPESADKVKLGATGGIEEIAVRSPSKSKRGRPKGCTSTACNYCGLIASSATNLNVHIRRRHSRQYSYACKVCSYYCVTKGDMDRHCATKKHKNRAEAARNKNPEDDQAFPDSVIEVLNNGQVANIEVLGEHISEVAAMEAGNQEETMINQSKGEIGTDEALDDDGLPSHNEENIENQTGVDQVLPGDHDSSEQDLGGTMQKKSKYDSVNSCTHCNFVAHSLPSLDLHIKRKHTKDFEYYCMACNYSAVTRREMTRHATTEKHKQKSQSYLESVKKDYKDPPRTPVETTIQNERDCESLNTTDADNPNIQNGALDKGNLKDVKDGHIKSNTIENVVTCSSEDAEQSEMESDNQTTSQEKQGDSEDNVCDDTTEGHPIPDETTLDNTNEPSDSCSERVEMNISQGESQLTRLNKSNTILVKENISDQALQEGVAEDVNEGLQDPDLEILASNIASPCLTKQLVRAIPFDASIVPLKPSSDSEITDVDGGQSSERSAINSSSTMPTPSKEVRKKKKSDGLTHSESVRIRCEDCGFMADGLSGLNVHISMKHPSKEKHFHCLLCGKSFYTESNLHQHLTSVGHLRNEQASIEELPEGGATFKCVKCTDPFETEQDLFMHIKEKHEELLREVNKYILEDTEQINKEREENQGNVCKYCGKVCKSSNSMAFLAHIRTHTGSKPFKCKLCKFATAQLGDARNHVKRHLGMREYKCHVCGWAFVMKKHLNTHLLGKHGVGRPKERKFECELCDRSFSEKWALNNHMKLHTGEKPYKCAWHTCHYSFLTLSAMKDHYRTHTGEKSFLCDLCGFAGGTRHALTKHRRQHTGEKPFRCDLCNFASTTQSHLTRHKRVHTGEKPYRCPWCDYRSNCAENIRKHILHTGKHEGVKMYNCPKCDYGTNAPMDFRNHLKEIHPDIENPDLAYLHAGIVSKSFECRLKGQGASFVETDSAFIADESSPVKERVPRGSRRQLTSQPESVQQVIIIQGFPEDYGGEYAIDAAMEESAAATLQTLAMGGQVTEVVHITEDGQVISTSGSRAHMSRMLPGEIELPAGTTQVVVVESPMEGTSCEEMMTGQETTVHTTESSSALDALLCAVTELGTMKEQQEQRDLTKTLEVGASIEDYDSEVVTTEVSSEPTAEEMQVFHEVQEATEPMEVVHQVVQSSVASSQSAQFKDVVQEVLQFAMCDMATAGHLMKEGLTRVIVNDEGRVHMVSGGGSQIIMQEEGHMISMPNQHMDLVGSDGEISQIIVTEGIARAMVQNSGQSFSGENTHYIVTELDDSTLQVEGAVYSQNAPVKSPCQEATVYQGEEGTMMDTEEMDSSAIASTVVDEQLEGIVVYSEHPSQEHIIEACETTET
ncbi:zinc finger protein 407 [Amia ocellicauda]|uniref:zinc finger protein 407 n=1 Tax=Amia ocellicauda TaxID=2972642 RepID=UPI003464CD3C